jgi:hypothetical protein
MELDYTIHVCPHILCAPKDAPLICVHLGQLMDAFCWRCEPEFRETENIAAFKKLMVCKQQAFDVPPGIDKTEFSTVYANPGR